MYLKCIVVRCAVPERPPRAEQPPQYLATLSSRAVWPQAYHLWSVGRVGRLRKAIQRYPKANAVLVRRHGMYVWGKDWIHAKTQAECYDYLFEAALRMAGLGINAARAPAPPPLANGHAVLGSAPAPRFLLYSF